MATITFDDIRPLYRLRLDAPEVEAFLARFPKHRIGKPSDGAQYVVFKPLGFDLLFMPPSGYQGGRTKHLRVLRDVFLFRRARRSTGSFPARRSGSPSPTRETRWCRSWANRSSPR